MTFINSCSRRVANLQIICWHKLWLILLKRLWVDTESARFRTAQQDDSRDMSCTEATSQSSVRGKERTFCKRGGQVIDFSHYETWLLCLNFSSVGRVEVGGQVLKANENPSESLERFVMLTLTAWGLLVWTISLLMCIFLRIFYFIFGIYRQVFSV